MPNRDVHVPVGLGTAFIASLYLSKDQKSEHQIYEAIGALFGGYWGSRLPDVFEPANNPHRRAVAHSLSAGMPNARNRHFSHCDRSSNCMVEVF